MSGVIEELQERIERLEQMLGVGVPYGNYIDQKKSPLGPRVHCKAVRRRIANGDERAVYCKSSRRYLLSPDALKEELQSGVSPSISTGSSEDDDFYLNLMKEVGESPSGNRTRDTPARR